MKIVTFSFDDGVRQDKRMTEILNRNGLKGTFNLNSGAFGARVQITDRNGNSIDHCVLRESEIADVYKGHEIAAHSSHHPDLKSLDYDTALQEIATDRSRLSELTGTDVIGFAYPGGHPNFNDTVIKAVREAGLSYARTIMDTQAFDPPDDFLLWRPTVGIDKLDLAERLADEFVALPDNGKDKLLYIWGHSYELDICDKWDVFEKICGKLSAVKGIVAMTNGEIFNYFSGNP